MSWLVSTNSSTFILQHLWVFVIACLDRQMSTSIYDKITPPSLYYLYHSHDQCWCPHFKFALSFRLKVSVVLTFDLHSLSLLHFYCMCVYLVNNNFMTPCAGFCWPILLRSSACTLPKKTINSSIALLLPYTTPPSFYELTM